MKTVKKTTKKFKPAYIVDVTECDTASDYRYAFIKARATVGAQVSDIDLTFCENEAFRIGYDLGAVMATTCTLTQQLINLLNSSDFKQKSAPWYKRFWKWLTRK